MIIQVRKKLASFFGGASDIDDRQEKLAAGTVVCQINFTDCLTAAVYLISGVRSVSLNSTDSTHAVVKPAFYSIEETAKRLGLAPQTLSNWICQGRMPIPSLQIGGRRLFAISVVENFIEKLVSGEILFVKSSDVIKRGRGRPPKLANKMIEGA